jgi:hypothetical protein
MMAARGAKSRGGLVAAEEVIHLDQDIDAYLECLAFRIETSVGSLCYSGDMACSPAAGGGVRRIGFGP